MESIQFSTSPSLYKVESQSNEIFSENPDSKARKTFYRPERIIDHEVWERVMGGDIGQDPPPLPENIREILARPCPFSGNPEDTIGKTHMLVLIPKTFNNHPFNLKVLSEYLESNKDYNTVMLPLDRFKLESALLEPPVEKSYWVLMIKKPFFGGKGWEEQKELIKVPLDGLKYDAPTMLEAFTGIVMNYIAFKKILFKKENACHFTRCKRNYDNQLPLPTQHFQVGGYGYYPGKKKGNRMGLLGVYEANGQKKSNVGIAPVIRFEQQFPLEP